MVRPKDRFWEFVEVFNDRFKCKFCGCEFTGGIPRIKSHLSGVKGRGINICTEVPVEVQAAAYRTIHGPNKKGKTTTSSSNSEVNRTISASSNSFRKLSEIHGKDKSLVDKKLTQFLISNNIAFNAVEAPSFIDFVRGAVEFGRDYELPSCSTLEMKFIPGFVAEVEEYVRDVKKSWALTGCTLMLDMCCDMKEQAIMNVIAYSPRGAVFMNSFDISKHQKNSVYLTDIVSSIIEEIGTVHVVQLITSKAVFDSVGDMLNSKYPQIYKTHCVACEIQLLLKDIFDNVEWVKVIIEDAKSIAKYMNEDTIILSLMRQYTNIRELKHPRMTKFASTYKMLQSIFDSENELRLLVASAEWRALDDNKKVIARNINDIVSNTNFWSQGREVLLVLKPFVQVLCLVEGDGSTSGYLYEAMERAEAAIKQCCGYNALDYAQISKLFEERRNNKIIHPIHAAAAFLNPAYMCSENFKEDQKMKEGIGFMQENLVDDEEKETFIRDVQLYRMKVSKLFTKTAMSMLKTSHPRVWWDYCGDYLPVLRKYAIRILSQPCSSSCEQRWSAFEVAQTKKMKRRTVKLLENFVYVRMNAMIMEKFSTLEERCLEPIDLKKCNELPDYVDLEQGWEDDSAELINGNFDNNVMDEANPLCSYREVFTKRLTKADITSRLHVPTSSLWAFGVPKGAYHSNFQVKDNTGRIWLFRLSTRKASYLKPVLTAGWLAFVREKQLQENDRIILRKNEEEINGALFQIEAKRCVTLLQKEVWVDV